MSAKGQRPIFFTSDTHFGHENIIDHCKRPFHGVEHMDEILIKRWNDTVPSDGLVFHLGDLAWGNKAYMQSIMQRLRFRNMVLVLGNHDRSPTWMASISPFVVVLKGPITVPLDGIDYVLSHEPEPFDHIPTACVNLCGHVHEKWTMQVSDFDLSVRFNVGVDKHNFRPWRLSEIKRRIRSEMKAGRSEA